MAAIAELHVIPLASLTELDKAAVMGTYTTALQIERKAFITYQYSGWILATLLPVLESNYEINLMNSEKERARNLSKSVGGTQFIFTQTEKDAYADRLDPSLFASDTLRKAFEEFNITEAPGIGEIMQDGIRFLRAGLQQIYG